MPNIPQPMPPQWIVHPAGPEGPRARLCSETGLRATVADILLRRGIDTAEAARDFLHPSLRNLHDPFAMKGMAEAVERIVAALRAGERIVVSGDYDVDGISSSALLIRFLREAGATGPLYFIPNRFEHGYGLTPRTTEALLALDPRLVITVDNGITALEEVRRLRASGVDTLVTDHHLPRPEGVPEGIVVNPVQRGCPYPDKKISGCGVVFKLITALRKRLRDLGWWTGQRPEPNLKDCLDLVAIATVADVVPLVGENRVLVHHGLETLNRRTRRPGLEALLNGKGRPPRDGRITARTLAFQIAPRINAAGRMTDGALAVELLLSEDPGRAGQLAGVLEEENDNRRAKGETMFREALQSISEAGWDDGASIMVASAEFHEGIIGIVASRLVERFHKPVMILAENGDAYKGSARSIPGIHLTEAIAECAHLLEEYGGHAGAAGCRLPKTRLPAFREEFEAACARQAEGAEAPAVYLEHALRPEEIEPTLVEQLLRLEPFGHHNEEPLFLVEQTALDTPPEILKEKHLKWRLKNGAEMLAWNKAQQFETRAGLQYKVRLGFNEYRGRRTVQLTVEDIREQG